MKVCGVSKIKITSNVLEIWHAVFEDLTLRLQYKMSWVSKSLGVFIAVWPVGVNITGSGPGGETKGTNIIRSFHNLDEPFF